MIRHGIPRRSTSRVPRRSRSTRSARIAATLTITAGILGLAVWEPGGSAGAAITATTTSTIADQTTTSTVSVSTTTAASTTSTAPATTTTQKVTSEGTTVPTTVVERRTEIGEADIADAAVADSAVTLPKTGSDLGGEAMLGFGFVAAGALLLIRRRRSWARS